MSEITIPYVSLRRPWTGFKSYFSDPANAGYNNLSSPSQNCLITESGSVESRKGYMAEFSIGVNGSPATAFYLSTYEVAFFALGTKLYYRDFTTAATYDTGITLTTGTTTRFAEYNGDIYCTNTTDGPRRIVCMRLNGNVAAGDTSITVDADGLSRLQVFSVTSGNLIINGTAEAFTNPIVPYGSINGAVTDGGLIKITSTANHNLLTGDSITITGVTGTTEANGTWTVTKIDATHFDLQTSVFTNAYVSGGAFTWDYSGGSGGKVHLTTTASQAYTDNTFALVVQNISSVVGIEKPSKIEFWKSRLHLMGFPSTKNVDQPNNSVIAGQFIDGQANEIQNIIDFTYGTGGATKITVGSGGKLTNILGVKDFLYFFLENKTYAANSADVVKSGSGIGNTVPEIKDELHGCLNEDCATIMGESGLLYATSDKRIMMISTATDTGAAVSAPQEDFDVPIRGHLVNMDNDQTGALVYHYRGGRQTICQLKVSGQWYWFIYDHNIVINLGQTTQNGAWQPPQSISPVTAFMERNGVLYGTDSSTDTVYSYFTTFTDNLNPIQVVVATGEFNVGSAMMKTAMMQGTINQPSQINMNCYVVNETLGRRTGSAKIVNGSDYNYSDDQSVGAVPVGSGGIGQSTPIAKWKREFGVYPSEANRVQLIATNFQDGGYFSVSYYSLVGDSYPGTFKPQL